MIDETTTATEMVAAPTTDWVKLAREAYSSSTTYFDASIRRQIEGNLRQFQGLHPHNSKYLADSNKARSRLFRPKTRAAIRKNEAIAAEAFFSTTDVVSVSPQDDNDDIQQASAAVMQELLQFRLTKSIPWFQIVIGAYQDALTVGTVASYQSWEYNPLKRIDRPCISLVPLENLRYDPGALWTDPVGTSPYLIELLPMYVKDVRGRMDRPDSKTGEAVWAKLPDEKILTAVKQYGDSVRLQREASRTDPKDQAQAISDFSVVWVHRNIVEVEGTDYLYYTLGCEDLLSEPVTLDQVHPHGKRPYVVGSCVIETHKNYPSSPAQLGRDVQAEINDVANLRIDNLKLALNKRYFVKRNKQVDLRSLTRNVPGSATLMSDPETDVKTVEFNDVTQSSYKEQEVLNLDFDDITGTFSGSSVQSNRKLNETVGGMELLSGGANQVAGYQLRTFVETWVEPVLRQLVLLEQYYETDDVLMKLAGDRAGLFEKFNIDGVTDELLMQELTLTVNIGMGATSPTEQITRFMQGMSSLKDLLADGTLLKHGLKLGEVIPELFGKLGYRDGARFFDTGDEDPTIAGLKAAIGELEAALEAKQPKVLVDAQVRKLEAEILSIGVKDTDVQAAAVKKGVEAAFSAMQAAEVLAAVPQVAPIADKLMQGAGYVAPPGGGTDPNYPAGPGIGVQTIDPMVNPKTGIGFTPGTPGDTTPLTPAAPKSPGEGAAQGIQTQEADSVGLQGDMGGLANGGMVDSYADGGLIGDEEIDPIDGLTATQRIGMESLSPRSRPAAAGGVQSTVDTHSRAKIGLTSNGFTDQTNYDAGINPLNSARVLGRASGRTDKDYGSGLMADGGVVRGPGTGTSDSVPALNTDTGAPLAVSNGEVVIPADVVQALGEEFFLELIAKYHQPVAGA